MALDIAKACLCLSLLLLIGALGSVQGAPTIETCDELVVSKPEERRSYNCYWYAVRASGHAEEAVGRLEAILERSPGHPAALHNLARIEGSRGRERAEELFLRSIEGYANSGEEVGRIWALMDLTYYLGERGRHDEADEALARASEVAEAIDDDPLRIQVLILGGMQAYRRSDYGRALRLYREAEAAAFPDGARGMQQDILDGLGIVASSLGKHGEAIAYFTREADLVRSSGNVNREAVTRLNIAAEAETAWLSGMMERAEFDRLAEEALDTAIRGGHPTAEANIRLLIARHRKGVEGLKETEAALDILAETGHWSSLQFANRLKAWQIFELDPERRNEALELIEDTIADARAAGDFENSARAMVTRAGMMVSSAPRQETVASFLELLDTIERLREIQPEPEIRARFFSRWRDTYGALTDFVIEEDIELAFETMERARARMLLDVLESADIPPEQKGENPLEDERSTVLEAIAGIQVLLMDPELSAERREESLKELETLENREANLRDRKARLQADDRSAVPPEFASLGDVQQALEPDQAMLVFELRGTRANKKMFLSPGASFVLVLARNGISRYELPAIEPIATQVELFTGLLLQEGASLERPAGRLYNELLADALQALPAGIERLIMVPDGPLHLLPFELLAASAQSEPVGLRFVISYVPSATAWLRLKQPSGRAAATNVLSLADPSFDVVEGSVSAFRKNPWTSGLAAAPLPFARKEAAEIAGMGGRGSRVLEGSDASEYAVKEALEESSYGIVHFGTHAVLDHRRPDRTAVLLTTGSEEEDGLLQMREIAGLDLENALVILSACSSATGDQLGGEGVMSLAHAFFRAGARTVLAATHPIRDEETARLMTSFAHRLGSGVSVAAAMASARKEAAEDGQPARAWAGFIVLGDGDYRPLAEGGRSLVYVWALGAILLAACGWWLLKRSTR
jgi:CHAT domain-containing protein/tetratricopeptide (TPR) repeat protein